MSAPSPKGSSDQKETAAAPIVATVLRFSGITALRFSGNFQKNDEEDN
jgi:hypothetical protein